MRDPGSAFNLLVVTFVVAGILAPLQFSKLFHNQRKFYEKINQLEAIIDEITENQQKN